jgi:hypothetical protein
MEVVLSSVVRCHPERVGPAHVASARVCGLRCPSNRSRPLRRGTSIPGNEIDRFMNGLSGLAGTATRGAAGGVGAPREIHCTAGWRADPDRDRQRACPRSPGAASSRRSSAAREWRTRTTIFVAARGLPGASPASVCAYSASSATDQKPLRRGTRRGRARAGSGCRGLARLDEPDHPRPPDQPGRWSKRQVLLLAAQLTGCRFERGSTICRRI